MCAPTEEGHFCCCRIGEIFWLNWLSRNLAHRYVYLYLHVKPISLLYFCFTDCIIYIFVLLFNSDNGKEFIATVVVDLLKESNPNCYIVTGRPSPRTPRDQGSVESANKVVQQVLKSILSENHLRSKEVNWTKLLGQVMAVCNSHSGIQKNSVSSYEAVFGQKYHQQLQCNLSEMRECKSIFQRLKLSPNERLETYVCEHNIVNVEVEDTDHNNDNDDDSDENEGDDLDEITFPDAGVFDGTSTSVVVPAAAVVTEASVPTLTGGSIEGGHGGGGAVTGGDGARIGYFSSIGSGDGSGIGLGSGISSVDVSSMAVQQAAAAGVVTSVAMAAIKEQMVRNTPPLSNLTPTCGWITCLAQ